MVSVEYSEAAVEVLDILSHMEQEYIEKIPEKFINFLKENKSEKYVSNLDHSKIISEMNLKPKTEAILGLIYMKYWANEQERIEFKNKIEENERIFREQMKEKYNQENLFNKENNKDLREELNVKPVEKQTFIQKLINKIKKIFRG